MTIIKAFLLAAQVECRLRPINDMVEAGIYIANHEIWQYLPDCYPADFRYDVLPQLVGIMKGYFIKEYFIDIGTIENYERARCEIPNMYYNNSRFQLTNPPSIDHLPVERQDI